MLLSENTCFVCKDKMSRKSFQELRKTQIYKRLNEFLTSANDNNEVNDFLELGLPNQM